MGPDGTDDQRERGLIVPDKLHPSEAGAILTPTSPTDLIAESRENRATAHDGTYGQVCQGLVCAGVCRGVRHWFHGYHSGRQSGGSDGKQGQGWQAFKEGC